MKKFFLSIYDFLFLCFPPYSLSFGERWGEAFILSQTAKTLQTGCLFLVHFAPK